MRKTIFSKLKKEKGLGLLAITMIFSVAISLLVSAALLTANNTASGTNLISMGNQAEQLANVGIDRVSWMILQKSLQDNSLTNINYNNTGLKGDDSSNCRIEVASTVDPFVYPVNVPAGRYKVKIIQCSDITKRTDGSRGKRITIESLGQVYAGSQSHVANVTRRVVKNIELYEVSTNLFNKAIIGNNIPGCMFCHLTIYGDIACMGSNDGAISHAGSSSGSKIYGDFYANGGVLNSDLWKSYRSDNQILNNGGDPNHTIKRNYNNTADGKISPLPSSMDTMKHNKQYILRQCTNTSTGNPGSIKVDYASQMIPGKLFSDSSTPTMTDKINRIKTAAGAGDPNYAITKVINPSKEAGDPNECYCIGYNPSSSYKGKYDINNLSNDLDETADYDSAITLVGSEDHPIMIDGKVYIDGDVLIKGVVSGQGVIYSSRNIYVLGDLKYKDGPNWSNYNSSSFVEDNKNKDQLGLVASGNILLGDPFSPIPSWATQENMGRNDSNKSYSSGYSPSNYNTTLSNGVNSKKYAWQGYIRSLMVDGLFDGNEQGASNQQFAKQYTNSYAGGVHDEYFFHHNRYSWDGRDAGEKRISRKAKQFESDPDGVGPNVTPDSSLTSPTIYINNAGKKCIPEKEVSSSPGLLPRGAVVSDNADPNTPSRKFNENYNNGWIPYSEWNAFVTRSKITDDDGNNASGADITAPIVDGHRVNGTANHIDCIMYAEGCIAGGNFVQKVNPTFHGSFVSNDTHYINAVRNNGERTTIYHDKRASDSFMGFPCNISFNVIGYEVKASSNSEFDSY